MSESRPAGDDATLESIQRSFARATRIQWWIRACYFALIGAMVLWRPFRGSQNSQPLDIHGWPLALIIAGIAILVVHLCTWACPNCSKSFGCMVDVRFCPKCGVPLTSRQGVVVPWKR
jgi:hypothetical protein